MKKKWMIGIMLAVLAMIGISLGAFLLFSNEKMDIPRLDFKGDISEMWEKSDVRNISFRYKDGERTIKGYADIKIQGTSSIGFEKKNYTINFYADKGHEEKLAIDVGWGEQSKYCLKANWIDRTHARNVVTAKLASQVQEKYGVLSNAPRNGLVDGFPVEIYNNGDFLGLYTFNIPKSDWQFAMDSDNPNHIVICGEAWEPANLFEGEPDFETWAVEVGEETEETLEKMKALFSFVINSTDEEFITNFGDHMDLDAAMNYYIMVDVAYLEDNLGKNMLIATYDGQKWYPSLYDLDTCWGSFYNGKELYEYEKSLVGLSRNQLFARLEQSFPQQLAERYFELREADILTKEHIMAEFEAFRAQIPEATFAREAQRWGEGDPSNLPGYDYDQIQKYLDFTFDRLDAKYEQMRLA